MWCLRCVRTLARSYFVFISDTQGQRAFEGVREPGGGSIPLVLLFSVWAVPYIGQGTIRIVYVCKITKFDFLISLPILTFMMVAIRTMAKVTSPKGSYKSK